MPKRIDGKNTKEVSSLVCAFLAILSMAALPMDSPLGVSFETLSNSRSPNVVDTVYVPADGSQVSTNISLTQGQQYILRITGMFVFGACDRANCPNGGPEFIRWADARFMTDDHFHHQYQAYVYLTINGSLPNISQYNSNHVYTVQVNGNGSPATFRIEDGGGCCYPDNSGALRVEILSVNEPAAIALGITPFSQYSIPFQNLGSVNWGSDRYGNPNTSTSQDTICRWGCFLSSWAMMLDYYGFNYSKHTNPRELNNWLRQPDRNGKYGYDGNYLIPAKVVEYANQYWKGLPISLLPVQMWGRNDQKVHELLSGGIPVILEIDRGGGNSHFVLAVGETTEGGTQTWYINDPGGCGANIFTTPLTTLRSRYSNQYVRMYWAGTITGSVQLASVTLLLASPAELLVIDPQGRRTGVDPRTGIVYNEIPDASYFQEQLADDSQQGGADTHPIKIFNSPSPVDGSYRIEVIGTGNGSYNLNALGYDNLGNPTSATTSGQTSPQKVDAIKMNYSSGGGVQITTNIFLPFISR